jgi:hypothetical protein
LSSDEIIAKLQGDGRFLERCHITDYTVLSQHVTSNASSEGSGARKTSKDGQKNIVSQYVLGISNWHYVRDHSAEKTKELVCTAADIQIYIKLSSDIFRSSKQEGEKGELEFAFDRNSACFTYASLISLLRSEDFSALCKSARIKYELKEGPMQKPVDEIDVEAELAAATSGAVVPPTPELDFRPIQVPSAEPEKRGRKAKRRLQFERSDSETEEQGPESNRINLSRKKLGPNGAGLE